MHRLAFDVLLKSNSGFLWVNLLHPSLHAKKYDKAKGLWQARVNKGWRFYFTIANDTYRIEKIIPHPSTFIRLVESAVGAAR
jgi:hypothetical protein